MGTPRLSFFWGVVIVLAATPLPSPLAGKVPPQGADEVVKMVTLSLLALIRHRSKLRRHLPPEGEGKGNF